MFLRRLPVVTPVVVDAIRRPASHERSALLPRVRRLHRRSPAPEGVELAYETVEWTPPEGIRLTDALYEEYALQSIRIPGSHAASDKTRPVRGDGLGRAAEAILSAAFAFEPSWQMESCRTPSLKASFMPARRIRNFSRAPGPSMRPLTSWPPLATMPQMPSAFAAAGSWATAPAPARAGRSRASCSTTGSRAAVARSGSASRTS